MSILNLNQITNQINYIKQKLIKIIEIVFCYKKINLKLF